MRVAWQKLHEESTVCTKKVFDFNQVLFLGDCGRSKRTWQSSSIQKESILHHGGTVSSVLCCQFAQ